MNRAPGDRVAIRRKIANKYDTAAESEVITWFEQLVGIKLEPGFHKLEKQLKNGQFLVKLAQKIQSDTPNCPEKAKDLVLKYSTNSMPFQQMANIQTFLLFCENYGVPKTGLFQTGDLFEGNNMQQVISCIQQLGSECQRNHFNGACIGPKPLERNIREFTDAQLKAGQSIIGMQAGSNKGATQSGMNMGSARHIVDARTTHKENSQQGTQESEETNQESSKSSSGDEESSDDE